MQIQWFCGLSLLVLQSLATVVSAQQGPFAFRDVAEEAGILPQASNIRGHGAGWGDVDGDGWADLYIGTFHDPDTQPNLLLLNRKGKFVLDDQPQLRISTRATGVLFADLDNDGDLDLYVGSMPVVAEKKVAVRLGHAIRGCSLFRNDGKGKFTDVSEGNGACPKAFGGRSATVLDYDGDGLLDLLVGEEPVSGYNGSPTHSSRLFRNLGGLKFEDVSRKVGLPEEAAGLGVATADVNMDGKPDLFLASTLGNYLLLNDGDGHFKVAEQSKTVFAWPAAKGDNMVCGVAISDINGDTLPDIVIGQHFKRPWLEGVANRLYLNRRIKNGTPYFEDVTEKAGLIPLPLKGPHVEIQDFDNDGLPDIYTSIVKFANGQPYPLIFRNLGSRAGLPRFEEYALSVNDYPTAEDRTIKSTGKFYDKMVAEGKIIYFAPGPSCDFDRDGRLDLFLANWWNELPSLLLHNETKAGNWLDVKVIGTGNVNRMGIGSRVNLYEAGKLGQSSALIGSREITTGYGYASSQEAIAHFGLADREAVDIEVILPQGQGKLTQKKVKTNQRLSLQQQ